MLAGRQYFRQAVTRLYFSASHAAHGLLAAHGIETATHEGVQRLIGLHFVVPGLLPKEAGRALSTLLARRHEADYRLLVDIGHSVWLAVGAEAEVFLGSLRTHLARAWPQLTLNVQATGEQ